MHECKDGVGELLLTWIVAIVGNVLIQDGPRPLYYYRAGHVYMPEMAD